MLKDKKRLYTIIAIALATILIPTGGFFTYRYLTKADDIDGKTELLSKLEESEKEEAKEDKKEKKKEDKEDKKEEDKKEESTNIVASEEKALSSNQTKEVTTNTNKKTTKKHEAKANNNKSNVKAINKLATHKAVATQNTNVATNSNNGWVKDDEAVARARARLYARTHKNSTVTTSTSNVSGGKRLIRKDPIYEDHSMVRDNTSGRLFKKSEEWKQYWKDNMRKKSNGESYEDCGGTAIVPVTYIVGYNYKYSDGTTKQERLSKPIYLGGEISLRGGRTITW